MTAPTAEGADALWYARDLLRDPRGHEDATVVAACLLIEQTSHHAAEIARAATFRAFIERHPDPEEAPA